MSKIYKVLSEVYYKSETVERITKLEADSEEEALEMFKIEGLITDERILDGNFKEESAGTIIKD